jgi:hypothetical protein
MGNFDIKNNCFLLSLCKVLTIIAFLPPFLVYAHVNNSIVKKQFHIIRIAYNLVPYLYWLSFTSFIIYHGPVKYDSQPRLSE